MLLKAISVRGHTLQIGLRRDVCLPKFGKGGDGNFFLALARKVFALGGLGKKLLRLLARLLHGEGAEFAEAYAFCFALAAEAGAVLHEEGNFLRAHVDAKTMKLSVKDILPIAQLQTFQKTLGDFLFRHCSLRVALENGYSPGTHQG